MNDDMLSLLGEAHRALLQNLLDDQYIQNGAIKCRGTESVNFVHSGCFAFEAWSQFNVLASLSHR